MNRKVEVAFGAAILTLLAVGAVSYRGMVVSEESDRWVRHTHEVIENLQDLLFALKNVESSIRGFVLTDKESYVETLRASSARTVQDQIIIRNLTVDNPTQQLQLPELASLASHKMQRAEMLIELRRTKGPQAAAEAIRTGPGQQIMDEVEAIVRQMQGEELRLLALRIADSNRRMEQTKAELILGTFLAVLIAAGAGWAVRRDSAARDLAEAALREGETRFSTMANSISQFAWMADEKGHIFWYNDRWFEYTGTILEEMAGWGWQKVHHPDHVQRVVDKISGCFQSGQVWEDTFPLRGRDGKYRWFLSRAVPIRDAKGKVLRWFGTNTDITDRKEAELKLALLSERLSLATAIAKVGVWEWEMAGKMSIWDATMFQIYGFAPEVPMPYERWAAAVLPEDLPGAEANLQKTIDEKSQGSAEFRIRLPDSSVRNISVIQSAVLDDRGRVIRLIGVNMDITERKRAEEALEQGAKDQIRFKDEFLSHVSHELRSPLTAIKQFTNILLGGLAGELNKEQREYQQIVLKNIRQLQSMIDDLLDVTRAEAGKLGVDPESVSASDAVTDSINTLRVSSEVKGVSLAAELSPGLPPVHADQTRLRQILIILLDNAIKFTPKGGAVKVLARLQGRDPEFVVLEVSDTGCGMSAEASARVFERLYQVEQPSQASRKGLGLGLFICKELVTRQGGEIWVKSDPLKGSTFSFTLPVFSLNNVIAPLLKDDRWPAESVALVMSEIYFAGDGSSNFQQEWRREVRDLVQRCLLPNLDVLLPKMSYGAEGERFFVAAFADEKGASILAKRIREQFECLPHPKRTDLTLSVTYTMLKPFPLEGGSSLESMVTTMATNLEESIKSQILSEGVSHE
ncbi:MAG: CHASE3 domain-containing protein [Candidatus Sulfotelmatobacter sp.]